MSETNGCRACGLPEIVANYKDVPHTCAAEPKSDWAEIRARELVGVTFDSICNTTFADAGPIAIRAIASALTAAYRRGAGGMRDEAADAVVGHYARVLRAGLRCNGDGGCVDEIEASILSLSTEER